MGATGLTKVPTEALVHLLRAVHRASVRCPVTTPELTRHGLQYVAEDLALLRGLDERAVSAVLISVIAERQRQAEQQAAATAP